MLYVKSGCQLDEGQRVRIYRNLHTGNFSIQDLVSKRVIAHGDSFILKDVHFKVYKTGQEWVRRTRQKRVHAYVIGTFLNEGLFSSIEYNPIFYDPYVTDFFIDIKTKAPVHESNLCLCLGNRCYIK